jgi:hypothetical protein
MSRKMLLIVFMASIVLVVGFIYSGFYNVAATAAHAEPVEWLMQTAMKRSVQTRARQIEIPEGVTLTDPALAEKAIGHYSTVCAPCHGAPGVKRAPWMDLNPEAPDLMKEASEWKDSELFWIIKHGIKMTGMPALGPSHTDQEVWAIAGFVRQLPTMSPERYRALEKQYQEQLREKTPSHSH